MKKEQYISPYLLVEEVVVETGFQTTKWGDNDGEVDLNPLGRGFTPLPDDYNYSGDYE